MKRWRCTDPSTVRDMIASACASAEHVDTRLGDVVLHGHQRDAATRLRASIERFGGALLADDVGLGKTYTALAAARGVGPVLVVAPAALADMWRGALIRAAMQADFVSFETLSRSAPTLPRHDLVIVDEAHHARNPLTRRYARLAELTTASRVLLLTATPVHNATADLQALLALFLGSRAERLTAEQRAACIVRRTHRDVGTAPMPHRAPPVWLDVHGESSVLESLLEVPAPCPPRDGGDGGALVTLSLVRAWASSDAALRATLRRRIGHATSLGDALAARRHPTRAELRAWVVGDDATQLAFPELLVDAVSAEWLALSECVERHTTGLRRALRVLADVEGRSDDARCAIVRDIRRRHPTERIVVFSQFADTVRAMFDRLKRDGGVAAVTANGAWVAGGPLTRAEALSRFARRPGPEPNASRAEAIDVMIATDLLSEGLNLQSASVVVHLDLPWTAARLTQRLGRVWRMASPHDRVYEFALAPPAPAEQMLRVVDVLRRKAGAAAGAVGESLAPLLAARGTGGNVTPAGSATSAAESLRALLETWRRRRDVVTADRPRMADDAVLVAAVRASHDGWVALLRDATGPRLIGRLGCSSATADPRTTLDLARAADGMTCVAAPARVERVLDEVNAFLDSARAAADAGIAVAGSRTHSAVSSRIAALTARSPAHRRAAVSRLAVSARHAVDGARSAGAERLLRALVAADAHADAVGDAGEAWLTRVIGLDADRAANASSIHANPAPAQVDVLIVLVPEQ